MDSPPTSWALATWVVPVVPVVWFVGFALLGERTPLADTETLGYGSALVMAVALALVGAVLTRVGGAAIRGVGWGLMTGGLACAVPSLWVLVT